MNIKLEMPTIESDAAVDEKQELEAHAVPADEDRPTAVPARRRCRAQLVRDVMQEESR